MTLRTSDFLFTYGTLMSSIESPVGAAERALLQRTGRFVSGGHIVGRVLDAGACPAAIEPLVPRWRIFGEVWMLPADCQDLMLALDRYEGCAPDSPRPFAYVRRRRIVRLRDGGSIPAWIYLWNGALDGLSPVPSGRWQPKDVRPHREQATTARHTTALDFIGRRRAHKSCERTTGWRADRWFLSR